MFKLNVAMMSNDLLKVIDFVGILSLLGQWIYVKKR
jgi:hypothetical protein